MIRGRDTAGGECMQENQPGYRFSGGADGSDVSPDGSDQSACRGAARPRCPETRRFRHVFGGRLRWPDGQAECLQLPEGPKQAATERVGCGRGSVITFRPHRELQYRRSRFDHPARTAFTVCNGQVLRQPPELLESGFSAPRISVSTQSKMGLSRASVLLPGPLQNSVSKLLRRLRRQGGVGPHIHSTERPRW